MQAYSDVTRVDDAHALPDIEYWHHNAGNPMGEFSLAKEEGIMPSGWYWWSCFPGCMPDGDAMGPFATEAECIADFQVQS
jgi:hypothetical protein